MRLIKRPNLFRVVFLTAVLLGAAKLAAADPITLGATVSGTFDPGSCNNCRLSLGSGSAGLTSVASSGTATIYFLPPASGFATPLAPGQSASVTLGILQGISTAHQTTSGFDLPSFNGATFTLTVTLTVPSQAGLDPLTLTGTLTGRLVQVGAAAQVQWLGPTTLTFDLPGGGTLTLTIPEVTDLIKCGAVLGGPSINGTVTFTGGGNTNPGPPPSAVPEPMTLFLLGAGLVGAAGLARRRQK